MFYYILSRIHNQQNKKGSFPGRWRKEKSKELLIRYIIYAKAILSLLLFISIFLFAERRRDSKVSI